MASFLLALDKIIHRIILLIAEVAILAMVIVVSLAVTLRYVFNTGLGWAEEVPLLLVTLFAFLAMAMGVRDRLHIGVNLFYNLFPEGGRARKFMAAFSDLIVLLCGLFMLYYGVTRCMQMYKLPGRLPMTGLATWWQYLPIPLAGFVISYDALLFLTGVIKEGDQLYSSTWMADPEKEKKALQPIEERLAETADAKKETD